MGKEPIPQPRPYRQQLLVDKDVQGALVMRVCLYGLACLVYFTVIQFFAQVAIHPGLELSDLFRSLTGEAIYWMPGLLVLIPVMIYDVLNITNRFAGPIFSMRREMQAVINGEDSRNLTFRDGDYWATFADQFNSLREEVLDLREKNVSLQKQVDAIPQKPKQAKDATDKPVKDEAGSDDATATEEATSNGDEAGGVESQAEPTDMAATA